MKFEPLRILVACEESGIVRDAFRVRGHDAWSCDIIPSRPLEEGESPKHIQDDEKYWMPVPKPPSTDLIMTPSQNEVGG